ncbi:MAG: type IV pilus assembly protein PilM, partial [Candidatus Saccharimonadales bacterium]
MGSRQKLPYFFKPKPIFGLDIGNGSLKVMQTEPGPDSNTVARSAKNLSKLVGYGSCHFDTTAIKDGVVVEPEIIAEAANKLFVDNLIGDVTTKRVAMTIPSYRSFTRSITLPNLSAKELNDAVNMEAEQYIPVPIDKLYLDYQPIRKTVDGAEILSAAVPREIVDSYMELADIMGLEPIFIETTMSAAGRLFSHDYQSDVPTVIIDFGSLSSDIGIFDGNMLTASTVQGGGEIFTKSIADALKVSSQEAHIIKTRYGLGVSKRQKDVLVGLGPVLEQITKEIRRLIRYYDEHYGTERPIKQLVTLGGGSNIPGLNEFLTEKLRLAVRPSDPWQYLDTHKLKLPPRADKQMYATAAGLSMVNP